MKELSYEECVQRFQSDRCDNFELSEDGKTISGLDKIKGALIIPEGVEVIDCDGQVRNEKITAIIMPDSVSKMIGMVNGNYSSNLHFIRLSSNLNRYRFYSCNLEEIIIPEGIKIIPNGAFEKNTLSNIDLPFSIEYIMAEAFNGNKITEITIPENTKVIFPYAFANCRNLKKVSISSKDTVVMKDAFYQCGERKDFGYSFDENANKIYEDHKFGDRTFGQKEEKYEIINGEKILSYIPDYFCGKLVIEEGTKKLSFGILEHRYGITEIYFPDSMDDYLPHDFPPYVQKIRFPHSVRYERLSIKYSSKLSEINLPQGIKELNIIEGSLVKIQVPEGVEKVSIEYIESLTNLTLPYSVKELSLVDLPNLIELRLPEELTNLDLRGLKQLKQIMIPKKVESLLINRLDNLEEITIPESVTSLGNYNFNTSFSGNEVLESATLLCKINIGNIFKDCTNLKTLTLGAGIKKFDKDFFNTLSGLETIYIPAKKLKYYSSRIPENLHNKIVELPAEK